MKLMILVALTLIATPAFAQELRPIEPAPAPKLDLPPRVSFTLTDSEQDSPRYRTKPYWLQEESYEIRFRFNSDWTFEETSFKPVAKNSIRSMPSSKRWSLTWKKKF